MKQAARDVLIVFAPPQRLRDWLRATFAARKAKGQPPPADFEQWLNTWQQLVDGLPTVVDGLTDAEIEELWKCLPTEVQIRELN